MAMIEKWDAEIKAGGAMPPENKCSYAQKAGMLLKIKLIYDMSKVAGGKKSSPTYHPLTTTYG